jgi:hypothetical protein
MTTKKFKTVSGYLRSATDQMLCRIPWDARDEARRAAIKAGQRDILNRLLPQLALPRIDTDEALSHGVDRLLANGAPNSRSRPCRIVSAGSRVSSV